MHETYFAGLFYVNLIQTNHRGHQKRKDAEQALAIHIWKVTDHVFVYVVLWGYFLKHRCNELVLYQWL